MKKTLNYIWQVIINLVVIIVILKILSLASVNFERVVLCSLVLIYLSINVFMGIWGFQQMSFTGHFYKELKDIKKLLNEKPNKYEEEEFIKFEKDRDKTAIKFYINSFFNGIAILITLIYLFQALY
ncbi:MAG: hypothetical protein WC619_03935 [Patescibacteria group bacterium]